MIRTPKRPARPMAAPKRPSEKPAPTAFSIDRGPSAAETRLILAHGAGAGITSSFFEAMAELLVERGFALTLFEFQYMASRRTGGPRRPPPKAETLQDEYRDIVRSTAREISGTRSSLSVANPLGGRVASMLADELFEAGQDLRPRLPRLSVSCSRKTRPTTDRAPEGLALSRRSSSRASATRLEPAPKSAR